MTWYVVNYNGVKYGPENISGASEKVLTSLGIHGYSTEAQAVAHPQTMNDVQAALGGEQALTGINITPGVVTPGSIAQGAGGAAAVGESLTNGDIFKALTSRSLWIRVAEGVLGVLLVAVAVAELGKGTAIGSLAKKVPLI